MEFGGSKFLHTLTLGLLLLMQYVVFVISQNSTGSPVSWTFNIPAISFISFSPSYTKEQNQHVSLSFRTCYPNGLIFCHYLTNVDTKEREMMNYRLCAQLHQGVLVVDYNLHQFDDSLSLGMALHDDQWHSVDLYLESQTGELTLTLDGSSTLVQLKAYTRQDISTLLDWSQRTSIIYYGGVDVTGGYKDTYPHFLGCLSDLKYGRADGTFTAVPVETFEGVEQGCKDMCYDNNPCLNDGQCVNMYTHAACDCFGTDYQGQHCQTLGPSTVTLRGYEWITFRQHDQREPILTKYNRFSLEFKTKRESGVLLYAVGGTPYHSHLTASVHAGTVTVMFGIDQEEGELVVGRGIDDYRWHNLTISHSSRDLYVYLDGEKHMYNFTGNHYHFSLDPEISIGGGDNFVVTRGLQITQNFVGCLKNVYVGDVSVLHAMWQGASEVVYNGGINTQPMYRCQEVVNIPISFPTPTSMLLMNSNEEKWNFDVEFEFKTVRSEAILFHTEVMDRDSTLGYNFGYIEVWVKGGLPTLLFVPSTQKRELIQNSTIPNRVNNNRWHSLHLSFKDRRAKLMVNNVSIYSDEYDRPLEIREKIVIGYGLRTHAYKASEGFVGCVRSLKVQGVPVDPIAIMEDRAAMGLRLDGCNITDYCEDNRMCEHGGKCLSDWTGVSCDCTETHYKGSACHFPKYLRSCDEYYQSGVKEPGVMLIDLDASGSMEPVYVNCNMGYERDGELFGQTVVQHNLLNKTVVRGFMLPDLRKILSYRGMKRENLIKLTSISGWCEQYIQYDCKSAPIQLGTMTWFKSANGEMVEYLGTSDHQGGHCSCSLSDSCLGKRCNCNNGSDSWNVDKGFNQVKHQLPITEITIKQKLDPWNPGRGNLTLGPLTCWGNNSQMPDQAVTFASVDAYLMSHPWTSGNLQISFRTHHPHSLILYQTGNSVNSNLFTITVTSAKTVEFYFSWSSAKLEVKLKTSEPVSNGQWHQISIQHDAYNILFMVDMQQKIVDIPSTVKNVLDFTGVLYIGGVQREVSSDVMGAALPPGLVGCMRGLVYNNIILSLSQLIDSSSSDVFGGCMTSCWPNPCENGAKCEEKWGTHQCLCVNKWAHSGPNCEIDINTDAVTLLGLENSFLTFTQSAPSDLLDSTIVFSFRTLQRDTLLLYLHDNLNNFLQVELSGGDTVSIKYNRFTNIMSQSVQAQGLSNGEWHQVVVENTNNYIKLLVDTEDVFDLSSYQKMKLRTYSTQPFKVKDETVIPHRPEEQPEDMIHVYIGGVPRNMSSLPLLTGCLRGFRIGETIFSMQNAAEHLDSVVGACSDGCNPNPCQNGGVCNEQWQDSQFECDCTNSEFTGSTCNMEASAKFMGKSILQYKFEPPPFAEVTVTERLDFVFQAPKTAESMVLLFVFSNRHPTHDFIVVYLDPTVGVFIQTNQGYAIHGVGKEGKYADGRPHHLLYRRTNSEMILTVRSEGHPKYRDKSFGLDEEGIGRVTVPDNTLDQLDTIAIGGIPYEQFIQIQDAVTFSSFSNFSGCVSEVSVYPKGDNPYRLRPLKVLRSKANNTVETMGPPTEDCNTRLVTPPPATTKTIPRYTTSRATLTMPPWTPGPAETQTIGPVPIITTPRPGTKTKPTSITPSTLGDRVYEVVNTEDKFDNYILIIVLSGLVFLLIVSLIIALILMYKRNRQRRHQEKKRLEELELKQPLNKYNTAPPPTSHIATLDEFSMVSATLGSSRKPNDMSSFKPPEDTDGLVYNAVPVANMDGYNPGQQQFFNRKKNRPASSISEVLEDMERQRQIKEYGLDPSAFEKLESVQQDSVPGGTPELNWPHTDTAGISCPNEDCRHLPIPEDFIYTILPGDGEGGCHTDTVNTDSLASTQNHEDEDADDEGTNPPSRNELHHSLEYNGDSGYEAESKHDADDEDEETLLNHNYLGGASHKSHSPPGGMSADSTMLNEFSEELSPNSVEGRTSSSEHLSDNITPTSPEVKLPLLVDTGGDDVFEPPDQTSTPKTSLTTNDEYT